MNYKTLLIETEAETIDCAIYDNGALEINHLVDGTRGSGITGININADQSKNLYELLKNHFEPETK